MTDAVAVADTIHGLVAGPNVSLSVVLAEIDALRRRHGDELVVTALATEMMTASALPRRADGAGRTAELLGERLGPSDAVFELLWLPISVAPRDRRIDLRAKRWVAGRERLRVYIFTQCKWCEGGTARNPAPCWRALPRGWTATHWREAAPAPGP
ncbi:hypothetical protein [Methylobacterium sp. D48H]